MLNDVPVPSTKASKLQLWKELNSASSICAWAGYPFQILIPNRKYRKLLSLIYSMLVWCQTHIRLICTHISRRQHILWHSPSWTYMKPIPLLTYMKTYINLYELTQARQNTCERWSRVNHKWIVVYWYTTVSSSSVRTSTNSSFDIQNIKHDLKHWICNNE